MADIADVKMEDESRGLGSISENSDGPPLQLAQASQISEPSLGAETSEVGKKKRKRNGKPITEKWRPVYTWLEGLDQREVVKGGEITEWLDAHDDIRQRLLLNHKNEHIFNYIQKCHARMISDPRGRSSHAKVHSVQGDADGLAGGVVPEGRLKRSSKKVLPPEPNNTAPQPTVIKKTRKRRKWVNNGPSRQLRVRVTRFGPPKPSTRNVKGKRKGAGREPSGTGSSSTMPGHFNIWDAEEIQRSLQSAIAIQAEALDLVEYFRVYRSDGIVYADDIADATPLSARPASNGILVNGTAGYAIGDNGVEDHGWVHNGVGGHGVWGNGVATHAMEANGTAEDGVRDIDRSLRPRKAGVFSWTFIDAEPDFQEAPRSIFECLMDREQGANAGKSAFRPQDVGNRGRRWTSHVEGWNTLGRQESGPVAYLKRQHFRTWGASWCAYTSSVAIAPTGGVDGVQKVLDLRFNPNGLPQLVCSCNAAPSELLLYNLANGRARELSGHNCQIQAVEYALDGDRIISCGTNIINVWDAYTGACVFTMGPAGNNEEAPGHKKKISAMAVNQKQSCLVATSGGDGETEILLWNIRTGELAADLNSELRQHSARVQSMDALHFCRHNLLICGSDAAGDQPAVVQMWDIDSAKHLMTFPACDSYITCLGTDPRGDTIIAGAGDATVALFDIRTGGAICRLPLGADSEATTVGFSACGTYFHASGTANHILVWDVRMISMEPGLMPIGRPIAASKLQSRARKPLHCLNHGTPMPTTQNAGQLPGFVDEGDGGVNDARWFRHSPILVTASGNSSVALWDVTLGRPCLKVFKSHSRCINTVAISPDDQMIASGGDDQKVVLYQNSQTESVRGWRLTHPLSDAATTDHVRQQLDEIL